mgnify:FL=1
MCHMTEQLEQSVTTVERFTPWQLPYDPRDAQRVRSSWVSAMNARADGLCPLVRTEIHDGYLSVVHRVPARSVSLSMIRAKGPLRLGQVAAVGVRIGAALAALHDERTAHGSVGLDSVLVAPDGQVWLAGAGLWTLAPYAGGPTAGDDVRDLARLLHSLTGEVSLPTSVELMIIRTEDPDPALRPSLQEFIDILQRRERRESAQNPIARDVREVAHAAAMSVGSLPRATPRMNVLGRLRALH